MNKDLKNYAGEDRIVTSHDYYEAVKALPSEKRYNFGIKSIDELTEGFTHGNLISISGYTGFGKCLGKGTKVLMFNGEIKKVEDIKKNDLLMGDDSSSRKVLDIATGKEKLYEIIPVKGSSYIVNESHIISLKKTGSTIQESTKGYKVSIGKVKKGEKIDISLKEYLKLSNSNKHILKGYRTKINFPYKTISINPYFLGLWLGDGTSVSSGITTTDKPIVNYLLNYAKKLKLKVTIQKIKNNKANTYSLVRKKKFKSVDKRNKHGYGKIKSMLAYLKELNLINNKHIPFNYKVNSKKIRLELLAGLIDSDGYLSPNNGLEFYNKNKVLCQDVLYLCRSLGFAAYIKSHKTKCNGKIFNSYRIGISGEISEIPTKLKRKKASKRLQKKDVLVYGFKVKPLNIGDYYGFTLNGNGRFLLNDFTVTHNTSLAQTISFNLSKQDIKVLWISYELSSRQFFNKYKDTDVPLFYLPRKKDLYDLDWVENRIVEGMQKHNIKIIFIDHLDYIVPMAIPGGNRTEMIGHTMRTLKTMATEYEIVIFLMVHTKQPKDTMAPGLESIKGSSFIGQESDAVFTMHRPAKRGQRDEYEDYSIFNILKHRDTGFIGHKVKLEMHNKMFYDQISMDDERAL